MSRTARRSGRSSAPTKVRGALCADWPPAHPGGSRIPDQGHLELAGVWSILQRLANGELGQLDPYPARSFFFEALREANRAAEQFDLDWQPTIYRWLVRHIENRERPIRERVYAAYSLSEIDPVGADDLIRSRSSAEDDDHWHYLARIRDILRSEQYSLEEILLNGRTLKTIRYRRSQLRPPPRQLDGEELRSIVPAGHGEAERSGQVPPIEHFASALSNIDIQASWDALLVLVNFFCGVTEVGSDGSQVLV